ncbi:uncharacterized protein ALTATR162_LOCUS7652 [Alternaria atra]|uniref:Uncharacterized protein n=1 Tax=Alternaria atra TaxID=119953 RepID=A0A8J2I8Y7_9PLEO|nr:uncharacterized protein ALTATR162_LOCUS7652 [Alternaria atra]CAG5173578.1 unnamed protein product [Alternaria atra]
MHSPIARLPIRPRDEDRSVPDDITEEVYMQPQSKPEAEEIAALNRKNSPFLRLSGELRNQIYERQRS